MKNKSNQISLNAGFSMLEALGDVTVELKMAILRVVLYHVGRENAISRSALMAEIHAQGIKVEERTVRLAISEMRSRSGIPIAGTGGIRGGYWILKDQAEADAYLQVELHARGIDLLEQESSIRKSFNRWYPGGQLRLPAA